MTDKNNNSGSAPAWPWSALPAYREDYRHRNPVPDPAAVVAELAKRRQWLIWRYEPGETEEKKYRKMPFYVDGGKRFGGQGDDKDRRRLVTFAEAAAAVPRGNFDGVGFAFLPDDGLIGVDLDGMIDPDSGEVSDRCQSIIDACASYTELSPSGKGVHIFCLQEHVEGLATFKSNKVGIECFVGAQFFTFTGRRWAGSPDELGPMPDATLRRLQKTVRDAKAGGAASDGPGTVPHSAPRLAKLPGRQRSLAETVALAEEAIKHLSADDYLLWIEMGLACSTLGSSGYLVWDAWSSSSQKYAGGDDTAKRWKSFKDSKITLGSLFKHAEAAGWESPWAKAEKRKAARTAKKAQAAEPAPAFDYTHNPARPQSPAPAFKDEPEASPGEPSETHFDATNAPAGDGWPMADGPPPMAPELPEPPDDDDWERYLVRKSGDVTACLANAELILSHMKPWIGVIGYDEFAERTVFRKRLPCDPAGPAEGEWTDQLDAMTAIWLQRTWQVEFSPTTTGQAVEVLARKNRFHPVREALAALPPWDGISRNGKWLADYLGVNDTPYAELVGRFFLRAMIKRVMEPGCKFDYCLVLEGEQGLGKSAAARILAWKWFADTDLDLSNKDALMALTGNWVYEISEMGSLMKAEERKQKSFLSRQDDDYRPPYGKRIISVPRQSVFIGTTNEEEYLKDATGGRRFWPVYCQGEFNLAGLRENIMQMYAEALLDYRNGERCWPSPEEQTEYFTPEQAKRGMQEPIVDILGQWVKNQMAPFTMAEAATDGLNLTVDKLTPAMTTRIGIALRKMGCGRGDHGSGVAGADRRPYIPPHMRPTRLLTPAEQVKEAKNAYGW